MARHGVPALSAVATFVFIAASLPLVASSHVRIVRLSSVEGPVQMDRATGEGLERAILNTPIVEGTRLVTGADGLAEVEFENESALRLTGDSDVKFSQLLMNDAGAKINQIHVVKGLVYLDTAKGDDIYRLVIGNNSFLVHRDSQLRLSVTPDQVKLAVLKGDVQLENQPQPVIIQKKESLTLDANNADTRTVAKSVDPDRFDAWNKEREDYSRTYADNEGYGGPKSGYGLQDLNYYGGFFYAPGYGYAWQPFGFANSMLGWSPYSNGAWMFYPGFGYSWASAYPWGWLPFHYGSWAFINGAGWAWLPGGGYGGQWYRLQLHDRSQDHESSRRLDGGDSSSCNVSNQLRHADGSGGQAYQHFPFDSRRTNSAQLRQPGSRSRHRLQYRDPWLRQAGSECNRESQCLRCKAQRCGTRLRCAERAVVLLRRSYL